MSYFRSKNVDVHDYYKLNLKLYFVYIIAYSSRYKWNGDASVYAPIKYKILVLLSKYFPQITVYSTTSLSDFYISRSNILIVISAMLFELIFFLRVQMSIARFSDTIEILTSNASIKLCTLVACGLKHTFQPQVRLAS